MILIAENMNSSVPSFQTMLESQDESAVRDLAGKLSRSGAHYIDVNAAQFHDREKDLLSWLVRIVDDASDLPLVIDSPDPAVITMGLSAIGKDIGKKPLINSITLETSRYETLKNAALEHDCGLIGLLMDEQGMPQGVDARLGIAERMVNGLVSAGIPANRIFLDPMVRPVAVDDQAGREALDVIAAMRHEWPDCHAVVGLSNVSYGLPARRHLNRAFLLLAMARGLDTAIINPLDGPLMDLLTAGSTLLGADEYCMDYLERFRP